MLQTQYIWHSFHHTLKDPLQKIRDHWIVWFLDFTNQSIFHAEVLRPWLPTCTQKILVSNKGSDQMTSSHQRQQNNHCSYSWHDCMYSFMHFMLKAASQSTLSSVFCLKTYFETLCLWFSLYELNVQIRIGTTRLNTLLEIIFKEITLGGVSY